MRIRMVFDDWREHGKSIYQTEQGFALSTGDFHSGTTFEGIIELDEGEAVELQVALEAGYEPVFYLLEAQELIRKLAHIAT